MLKSPKELFTYILARLGDTSKVYNSGSGSFHSRAGRKGNFKQNRRIQLKTSARRKQRNLHKNSKRRR